MLSYDYGSELAHHGIKGMKWGVRRYQNADGSLTPAGKKRQAKQEKKEAKKEVRAVSKALYKSGASGTMVTMATASKFSSKDYERLSRAMDSGRLLVDAQFKKNLAERSVDLYIGGEAAPTMRVRMDAGKEFTVDFVDKADQIRYNEFVNYYNKRHS